MQKVKTILLLAALVLCFLGIAQAAAQYPVYCEGSPVYRCTVTPSDGGPSEVTYGDTLVIEL
jgi:hypothetical protein